MPGTDFDFVVQEHFSNDGEGVHWDLMLSEERGDGETVLATWRTAFPPTAMNLCRPVTVHRLFDHRIAFLDYQGALSKDRGWCRIFDRGRYRRNVWTADARLVIFEGVRVRGGCWLKKLPGDDLWILAKSAMLR